MLEIMLLWYLLSSRVDQASVTIAKEPSVCVDLLYKYGFLRNKPVSNLREKIIFNKSNFFKFSSFIHSTSNKYRLDPLLVKAVIIVESKFNPEAGSHKGAQGLMQLMAGTAKEVGVQNRLDPYQNIEGGVKYLKKMLNKFDNNVYLALAAYNAGPSKVLKYKGIPPYKETQNYVKRV
ncbi:MAG: hypothetical protein DRQ39_11520, partial [Gammaproteobacteria bacterium]